MAPKARALPMTRELVRQRIGLLLVQGVDLHDEPGQVRESLTGADLMSLSGTSPAGPAGRVRKGDSREP
jgi:hypothetical protein